MGVAIELAGPFRIVAYGTEIDAHGLGSNGRVGFAYLALARDQAVRRDELAEAVWGDVLPATWETALRGVVSRARAVLRSAGLAAIDVLRTGPGWYQLRLPAGVTIDVEEASGAVAEGRRLLAAGDPTAARCSALNAVQTARRPFLAGCTGQWVEQRQAQLDAVRLGALELLADSALAAADWVTAAQAGEEAVALAPLRETAHHRVIAALTGAGNRGEALRAYERCRGVLVDELGVSPSPDTEALYRRLLEEPADADTPEVPATPPARTDLPPPLADRLTACVGRRAESDELRLAWERAAGGTSAVAIVAGEAGIGKTRLIGQVAAAARADGALVLYGRCDEDNVIPFQPFIEALSWYAERASAEVLERLVSGGGALGRFIPGLADRLAVTSGPAAGSAAPDRGLLFEAVRAALGRLAAERPLLVALDDVHWADRPTLALIRHVLRGTHDLAVLFVLGYRVGEPGAPPLVGLLADLRREHSVLALEVGPLGRDDVAELIAGWAGHPAPAPLATAVHDETAGNPFFVEEVLRLMAGRDELGLAGGLASLSGEALPIPKLVQDVVLARAARLGPEAGRVLAAAAVAGRDFSLGLLERVSDLAALDVLSGLEQALSARLVEERIGEPGRFNFPHALVRRSLYEDITAARRQRLHLHVADALVRFTPPVTAAELAHHLLAAGPAAGDRAVDAARRAAAEACEVFAYEEAARYCGRALPLVNDDVRRAELLLEMANAHWWAGDTDVAGTTFEEAAAVAAGAARRDLVARATFGVASRGPTVGRADRDTARLLAAALGEPPDDRQLAIRLRARLGDELAEADPDEADRLCREAVDAALLLGDPSTEAYTLLCQRFALLGREDPTLGLVQDGRILDCAHAAGDDHMRLEGHIMRATHLLVAGRAADAAGEVAVIDELATRLRQPFYLRYPPRFRAAFALAAGADDEARCWSDDAYAIERRVHGSDAAVHRALQRCALHWEREDHDALSSAARELTQQLGTRPPSAAVNAFVAATAGRADEATLALHKLVGSTRAGCPGALSGFTLTFAAATAVLLGNARMAEVVLQWLAPCEHLDMVAGAGIAWFGSAQGPIGRLGSVAQSDQTSARVQLTAAAERDEANGALRAARRARATLAECQGSGV